MFNPPPVIVRNSFGMLPSWIPGVKAHRTKLLTAQEELERDRAVVVNRAAFLRDKPLIFAGTLALLRGNKPRDLPVFDGFSGAAVGAKEQYNPVLTARSLASALISARLHSEEQSSGYDARQTVKYLELFQDRFYSFLQPNLPKDLLTFRNRMLKELEPGKPAILLIRNALDAAINANEDINRKNQLINLKHFISSVYDPDFRAYVASSKPLNQQA
jgi:hypothetical protein